MNELFDLPVTYQGEELLLPAQLLQSGYIHQFKVEVNGQEVVFENDEEGNYRAMVDAEKVAKQIDVEFLKAIAEGIENAVR